MQTAKDLIPSGCPSLLRVISFFHNLGKWPNFFFGSHFSPVNNLVTFYAEIQYQDYVLSAQEWDMIGFSLSFSDGSMFFSCSRAETLVYVHRGLKCYQLEGPSACDLFSLPCIPDPVPPNLRKRVLAFIHMQSPIYRLWRHLRTINLIQHSTMAMHPS